MQDAPPGARGQGSKDDGVEDDFAEDAEVVGGFVIDRDGEKARIIAVRGEDDLMLFGEIVISFYRIARATGRCKNGAVWYNEGIEVNL